MSRCSIILVHGTWGRGFFPKRREVSLYPPNKRYWFEEGSQFCAGLDAALKSASLDWPIRAFLWSGANSVHARDSAAQELSGQLRKGLQEDPDARAVIVAHSHGGNVVLRALQHLDSMANRIRVVTLATPFLRVFARKSLQLPFWVKLLVWGAISIILSLSALLGVIGILSVTVGQPDTDWFFYLVFPIVTVLLGVASFFIVQWLNEVFTNPRTALAIEEVVHYDTKGAAASRMLVIRGVDDEASLSLAAGSIGSRLSFLTLVGVIPGIYAAVVVFIMLSSLFAVGPESQVWMGGLMIGSFFGALIFFFVPGAFKSFFGREFLVHAMTCDIAVDSVPDTLSQVDAITLRPVEAASSKSAWTSFGFGLEFKNPYRSSERLFSLRWFSEMIRIWWRGWRTGEFVKPGKYYRLRKSSWRLRHGIYNHPDCVDEIVHWLRRVT
jgi:hypothetical protein